MSDEIKEILDRAKEISDYGADGKQHTRMFNQFEAKALLDYITNLQQRLEASQTNEETYRLEMQDITKCLGLKEDTLFDEVKEFATDLQQENDRLNNIINELEDIIVVKLQRDYYEHDYRITTGDLEEIYDRLKELKENNRE